MSGWKTILGGVSSIVFGVYQIISDNYNEGITLIIAGIGLLGIGGKLDKLKR